MRFTSLYLAPASFDSRPNIEYNVDQNKHWDEEEYNEDHPDDHR